MHSICMYLTDDIIYVSDVDGQTFLHWATLGISGEDMRRILTEIPLSVIIRLLNARNSWDRTPLCQAAAWVKTNADVVIKMVQFVMEYLEQPGPSSLVFNICLTRGS